MTDQGPRGWTQADVDAWLIDRYEKERRAGLHDDHCEQDLEECFWRCACRLRSRMHNGPLELPGPLLYSYPTCRSCWEEVEHDGDGFVCRKCHIRWSSEYQDDEGQFDDEEDQDVATAKASWLAARARLRAREEADGAVAG